MKVEIKSVQTNLILSITKKEAQEISTGISELWRHRDKKCGLFSWPNTATAHLSHALVGYLNGEED